MKYDNPAFPFDLTRTPQMADVADMIESSFHDMWNPAFRTTALTRAERITANC